MALKDPLVPEWQQEIKNTRKMLERVPFEKGSWKPHEKSMTLERLSTHVAEIPNWMYVTLTTNELDFSKGYQANKISNHAELMTLFEDCVKKATEVLATASDEKLMEPWTLRNGDHKYFTMPKLMVLRNMVFSHIVHHRAQLSVYLRLLDIPVPGMYGPSADER